MALARRFQRVEPLPEARDRRILLKRFDKDKDGRLDDGERAALRRSLFEGDLDRAKQPPVRRVRSPRGLSALTRALEGTAAVRHEWLATDLVLFQS